MVGVGLDCWLMHGHCFIVCSQPGFTVETQRWVTALVSAAVGPPPRQDDGPTDESFKLRTTSRAPASRCLRPGGLAENYPTGKFDMLGGVVVGGGWGGAMLGGATRAGGPSGELAAPGGAWQPWDPQTPPVDSQHHRWWSSTSSVV
jgi:hypothetical protein